jgi:PBP1b-binding outer membrane lipoprotein LpoB
MRPRFIFLTVGLVAVLVTACATQATQVPAPPQAATQTSESVTQPQVTSAAPAVVAVATSRGPNLEAIDPATVSLASGQLQLVEFFRFT